MNTEDFKRKLTAILSADVQGYSRLMGEDEDNTVRTLTAYRALTLLSYLVSYGCPGRRLTTLKYVLIMAGGNQSGKLAHSHNILNLNPV